MIEQTATDKPRRGRAVAGLATAVVVFAMLAAVVLLVGSGDDTDPVPAARSSSAPVDPLTVEPQVSKGTGTLDKLVVEELIPGTGPAVEAGQTISVNYKLVSYATGELIDSSWTGGAPFSTRIGVGELIKGWDEAIPGQKVGSRIQLDVPADLAYGPQRGDLRFVVDILAAK
ncbi:FKBP-type peptidyl-prolyl cis-trans isomerase [Actinoplanes sp. DH11]|uniref:FKBP-type peptidyl-prolyl cis-trans isomerase n=1 Tax=Actinoplanes sp. DH11 TaxID=2857011 RepID=UPI001E4CE9FB|nr:FKBP-type peptidyl-prolyl cis-trans isomerase [Actinoplanes sp. DH11]